MKVLHTKFVGLLLLTCFIKLMAGSIEEKPMVVVIPSYNNARWVKKNLHSVLHQEYKNFRVIYIDDCSKDQTLEMARQIVAESARPEIVTIISNSENQGALKNIYEAVWSCHDQEIVVTIDGDDWFYTKYALQIVNEAYSVKNEVWLTHGSYVCTNGDWGISKPVPKSVVQRNMFRELHQPSHLRTFYAWLFKKIEKEDLLYEGEFFPMTWDQAMMYPMLEMAGERHAFISKGLYVYNIQNPINDHKKSRSLQKKLEKHIRKMKKYKRL